MRNRTPPTAVLLELLAGCALLGVGACAAFDLGLLCAGGSLLLACVLAGVSELLRARARYA